MVTKDKLFRSVALLVAIVLAVISFHAPISVFLSHSLPQYEPLIKSWKEIIIIFASLILLVAVYKKRAFGAVLNDWLVRLSLVYISLHILIAVFLPRDLMQTIAGALIDLRYIVFFLVILIFLRLYPEHKKLFVQVSLVSAAVVVVFGVAQVILLPDNFLEILGYSKDTIQPYQTIDQNPDYVRINSTLRGPNPLGIYAASFAAILLAFILSRRQKLSRVQIGGVVALIVSSLTVLWHTYSRSAVISGLVALSIVATFSLKRYIKPRNFMAGLIGFMIVSALIFSTFYQSPAIQKVVFHNDPSEANPINSDDHHAESLSATIGEVVRNPFGNGVGSTGSASIYGGKPVVVENQYLFVAHEVGILGMGLFISIFATVLFKLYSRRRDYLALGVFASGIGIALASLVQPVFIDDTVSIVWWGLAAIALAYKKGKS